MPFTFSSITAAIILAIAAPALAIIAMMVIVDIVRGQLKKRKK